MAEHSKSRKKNSDDPSTDGSNANSSQFSKNSAKKSKIEKITVYPEQREASHPTTSKIIDRFDNICIYKIIENSETIETFKDSLNENQKLILSLLNISENEFWNTACHS